MTLEDAKKKGVAQNEGDGLTISLQNDDFAWVDLGGVTVEVFFQPAPKPVFVPFTESVDFTVLNIFLVMFFLAALFVISAANRDAEGEEFADDLNDSNARIAKLLIKPPENQKNPILEKFEKKKDSGEVAQKHKGDDGQAGKKEAPKISARAAPKGDPNNKDQARLLVAKVFGAQGGGISTLFGHQGLGGELKGAMGNLFGAAPGDAAALVAWPARLGFGWRRGGRHHRHWWHWHPWSRRWPRQRLERRRAGWQERSRHWHYRLSRRSWGRSTKNSFARSFTPTVGKFGSATRAAEPLSKLDGKVAVKFVISPSGSVASSQVAQTTVNNAELEACVAGRVRTWMFSAEGRGRGGGDLPVHFQAVGQLDSRSA